MRKREIIILSLLAGVFFFLVSCSKDDATIGGVKMTMERQYESSNLGNEPEDKYDYYKTLDYGGMEYNLPKSVSIFNDFVEKSWDQCWTLAEDYPYVINSYDRLYSLTEWKLNVDFEKYSLIAIGAYLYNSACSYKLDVVKDNSSYKVELSTYNPPIYLDDVLWGVILLQVPKIPDNTLVNFKSTTYQIEE